MFVVPMQHPMVCPCVLQLQSCIQWYLSLSVSLQCCICLQWWMVSACLGNKHVPWSTFLLFAKNKFLLLNSSNIHYKNNDGLTFHHNIHITFLFNSSCSLLERVFVPSDIFPISNARSLLSLRPWKWRRKRTFTRIQHFYKYLLKYSFPNITLISATQTKTFV